ncbi:MAG: TolC family protein [Elusimicrobiota bacterium]|jgi:outer membrane protein TolC
MPLIALIALFVSLPLSAQPLDLETGVRAALERSPELRGARAQGAGARAGMLEASLLRLPRLSARGSWTRSDDPLFAFGALLQQRSVTSPDFDPARVNRPGYRTDILGSLEAGMPLFTGFELSDARRLGELGVRQAEAGGDGLAQKLRYDAAEAWLKVLLERRTLEAVRSHAESAAKELENADRLRQKGLVLGADYYAAAGVLEGLRAWVTRLEAELEGARARLRTLTGLSEDPPASARLSEAAYPLPAAEELAASAVERRGDLKAAALQERSAEVGRRMADFSTLPRVDAFAALQLHSKDLAAAPSDRMVGVRMNVPFGDASWLARREGARARLDETRARREALVDAARLEALQAHAAYAGVVGSLPRVRDMLERSRKSLELFRPLYREGRQSVLEALRAEEATARAEAALAETLYGLHAGWAGVRLAAGTFDEDAVRTIAARLQEKP